MRLAQQQPAVSASVTYNTTLRETWLKVFQVISDNPQLFTREAIRKLEAARELDGQGPMGAAKALGPHTMEELNQ